MILKKKEHNTVPLHPLAGGDFINWIKLLLENGGIDRKYIMRAFKVSLVSLLGIPFRIFENAKFGQKIEDIEIEYPPIFIIGHWRSGTTYLHKLMTLDKNLGYVTNFQTFLPEIFLGSQEVWKPIFQRLLPEKRPVDNVTYSLDSPEEEEYALGNMSPYCFYHGWFFPKNMKKFFNKFALFDGVSEQVKTEWKIIYVKFLKKVTYSVNGKRLVIKNPANTARIKILLEIFPDAKFIHIYRNPYVVYASTKHFYQNILPYYAFQDISEEEIEENIITFYQKLMQAFLNLKNTIPPENFAEIKYEDFEKNEIEEMRKIYNKFNFSGFEEAENDLKNYIFAQGNYKKNRFVINEKTIQKIGKHWKFAIEKWQYSVPEDCIHTPNN